MRIIFATGNEGKMREIRDILAGMEAEIVSMKEAGLSTDVEETGTTFEENAVIKAKAIAELTDDIVLADDSGLEVDRLEGVPKEKRTARFVCAIAAVLPNKEVLVVRETIEGYIGFEIAGCHGFGYDPIFYVDEFGCSTAELTEEEKNVISHRGKALRVMREKLVSHGIK